MDLGSKAGFPLSEFGIQALRLDKRLLFPVTETGKQATKEVL